MYVIKRLRENMFVAYPGDRSYTKDLLKARVFRTREDAKLFGIYVEREHIVRVEDLLHIED